MFNPIDDFEFGEEIRFSVMCYDINDELVMEIEDFISFDIAELVAESIINSEEEMFIEVEYYEIEGYYDEGGIEVLSHV